MRKNQELKGRAVFATRFAAVAATVGSAVGLGNIWRFPYEAGAHGGGAFMLCYMLCVLVLGIPVLCGEFCMGRGTRSNVFGAYLKLSPKGKWQYTGYIGIIASFLIISFYSVVAGWTMEYCVSSALGELEFTDTSVGHAKFMAMTTGCRPLIWTVVFLLANFAVLSAGVTKGIERMSNIMMPVLFILLIAFCINSAFLPGFRKGMEFLFKPDFSQITPSVALGALGQAFFSMSLGLGCMMTYSSYFNDKTKLGRTATISAILDASVAILAGIIIFPAVFSFGLSPQGGPTLVFEVLPYIFSHIPGGKIWATLFFLLLFIASITSTVSMSEISISFFCDEKGMSRKKGTLISSLLALIGGILCALSFGKLSDIKIFDMTFFNLFDYVSSNILLPIGGFICSVFVGWYVDKKFLRDQFTNFGKYSFRLLPLLRFALRWICPIAILLIFLNSLGII